MRKNREDDAAVALEALTRLPRTHQCILSLFWYLDQLTASDVQEDIDMIGTRLQDETRIADKYGHRWWAYVQGALYELSRRGMWNRVLLVFCAFALQNMSGAAAINYYSPTSFSSLGITDVALYTGIYGLVKGMSSDLAHN